MNAPRTMNAPRIAGAEKYLTEREAHSRYRVSRATWRRWMAQGYVPRPVRLGPRTIRWLAAELDAFDQRLAEDRKGRAP